MKNESIEFAEFIRKGNWIADDNGWYKHKNKLSFVEKTTDQLYDMFTDDEYRLGEALSESPADQGQAELWEEIIAANEPIETLKSKYSITRK